MLTAQRRLPQLKECIVGESGKTLNIYNTQEATWDGIMDFFLDYIVEFIKEGKNDPRFKQCDGRFCVYGSGNVDVDTFIREAYIKNTSEENFHSALYKILDKGYIPLDNEYLIWCKAQEPSSFTFTEFSFEKIVRYYIQGRYIPLNEWEWVFAALESKLYSPSVVSPIVQNLFREKGDNGDYFIPGEDGSNNVFVGYFDNETIIKAVSRLIAHLVTSLWKKH